MSMAFIYETFGKLALVVLINVVIVKTVVTPSATRAGDASLCIQNDTHDITTINIEGK